MKKEKIKSQTDIKAKTVFQEFADWLANDLNERDEKFEVTVSDRAFVVMRTKLPEIKE